MLLLPPKIFLVFSLVLVGLFLIYPTVNAAGCSIDVFWRWTDGKDYSTQPSPISVSASIKAVANFNSCNINKSKDSAYFLIFSPGGSSGQRVGLPLITTTFVQYNADIALTTPGQYYFKAVVENPNNVAVKFEKDSSRVNVAAKSEFCEVALNFYANPRQLSSVDQGIQLDAVISQTLDSCGVTSLNVEFFHDDGKPIGKQSVILNGKQSKSATTSRSASNLGYKSGDNISFYAKATGIAAESQNPGVPTGPRTININITSSTVNVGVKQSPTNSIIVPSELPTLLDNGTFLLPLGAGATNNSTPSLSITKQVTLNITDGGTSTVVLPSDSIITRTDGSNFDATKLKAGTVDPSSLSGFKTGVVVNGALQWGLANSGLQFSNPISISIFVGTALNGQTLNILRSTSGSGGWTNDGIIPPTCVVSNNLCSFTATKASYFVATLGSATPSPTLILTSTPSGGGTDGAGEENWMGIDLTIQDVASIINGLACWLTRIATAIMVIFLVIAGLRFMYARGEPAKYESAKKNFQHVLIGILVIMAVYVIIATVVHAVGRTDFSLIPLVC